MAGPGQERYKLEEFLGEGGFGEVWLATDTELDRRVAIKSLKAAHDLIHRGRFRGEARMLARLNHPNITAIYDVNFDEAADRFYLVTEYVEGKPLSEVLKSGQPLPLDVVLDIALGVLRALSYAHDQGVIHRDVKPGNVMIADDVKLTDFGLANLASHLQRGTRFMAGTIAYMAPEQIEGRPSDGRTDLYSLGVIMFELLTGGRRPFEFTDEDELLDAHLHTPPPPLSQFASDVPLVLEYVVTRLLAKDPEERYPSADAVMEVLASIQARLRYSRPGLQLLDHDPTAVIGRAQELERIKAVWAQVQVACQPRLLVLQGEMGVGKHKLVAEFLRQIVGQGCAVLTGRCDPQGTPYAPYAEILATVLSRESRKPSIPGEQLELLLSQVPGLAARLDVPPAALAQQVSPDVQRAGWQLCETALTILADMGPTVVFVEDASLLDEASLALTRYVIQHGRGLPLLFIAACRDEGTGVPWLGALHPDDVEVMTVGPLSEVGAKAYLSHLLQGSVSDTLVGALYGKSGGIPFNIEAITGQMMEAGELFESDKGEWRYTPVEEPQPKAPRHNLPAPLTPFIGRAAVLAEIKERLRDPACRLLTLIGPGGSGKTRLALEAAAEVLSEDQGDGFAHGVFFVDLAPLQSEAAIVPTVAKALGFSFYEGGEPRGQLLDYVRQKRLLIIMDNFEHLLAPSTSPPGRGTDGGAELVPELLRTASDVKILVTSRVRLNVQGEHLFPVAGMRFPDEETALRQAQDIPQYSAAKLFLSSVRRAQPGFELAAEDLVAVAGICRRVQGMPLAILLAAAWVELLTPAEIAAELDESLDFLETDLRDVPSRQRSIRAVFEHSWRLLSERERELLSALSVFRGGFTREAAKAVAGASLRELMVLVHKSLLQRTPAPPTMLRKAPRSVSGAGRTGGRYEVHELLRQYAAEKLKQSPAASEVVQGRYCDYFTAALQVWGEDLKGQRQQVALREIEVDSENIRAAWDWAVERRQMERLDQALVGLCRFYSIRGRYQEGEAACHLAEEKLRATAAGTGRLLLAQVLSIRAFFNWKLGRTEFASQQLRKSLALLERSESDDQRVRLQKAYALLEVGPVASGTDRKEAREWYEQSLSLFRGLGDRYATSQALYALGEVTRVLGLYAEAERFHKEGLAIREALGDQRGIADSLGGLSAIAVFQGQLEEGERLIQLSIAIHREIGNRAGIADGLNDLGRTLNFLGEYAGAHTPLDESVALYNDLGIRSGLAEAHSRLSYAKWAQDQQAQARAHAQMCLRLSRETGYQMGIGFGVGMLGAVALAEGAYAEAQRLYQEAVTVFREIGQRDELGWALAGLGLAELALSNIPHARQCFYEALRTAADIRSFMTLILVFPAVVLLLIVQREWERALEFYALISRYPALANSRIAEDLVGRQVNAVAASLPPDVVAAAQERGRARDLDATVAELLAELEGKEVSQPLVRQLVSEPGGLEEQPSASTRQPTATVGVPTAPVGLIANRFEISDLEKDLLGAGETAHVYRGTDTQTGQAVAIKALKPEIIASQPDLVVRFIREGEALCQLDHPNIVKMVASVEDAGQHYIIEEYVAGGSLQDLLGETSPEGALPITHALQIALELADALARAHHLGVIHRDLKPANVLLAEDGPPRLTDFGHAHLVASPRLTRTGALVGSVGYLSPEACNGETLDARADIWSLGVLLYEMLTGELPFVGDTLIAAITAILTQPIPDLAARRPDVPAALADLVYHMLEKDRDQRVPGARQVGAELEAILAALREE